MLKTLLELIKKENGIVIGRTRNKGKRLLRFIIGNIGYVALHSPSGRIKLIRCIGLVSKQTGGIAQLPSEFFDYYPSVIDSIEFNHWKDEVVNSSLPAIKISLNRNVVTDIAHKVEPNIIGLNVFLLVAEEDQVHVVREWKAFFNEVFVDKITVKPQPAYPVRVKRVTPIEEKLIHWDGNTYLKCGSYDKDHAELWKKELGATSLSIELLKGRILKRIFKEAKLEEFRKNGRSIFDGGDSIIFEDTEGYLFILHHEQDCCETVELEDVVGDLMDLLGYPLLESEEVTSDLNEVKELPPGDVKLELIGRTPEQLGDRYLESATWTFYKFATIKGHVNMRWMGSSNGYYSESVELTVLRPYAIEALDDAMPLLN